MAQYVKTEEGYKEPTEFLVNKMDKDNPVGTGSFSMGRNPGSVVGVNSHAEGVGTTASGSGSHAEGVGTTASGSGSHAEGSNTTASGARSHAEGVSTTASGERSHAEGSSTNEFSSVVTATNPTNADIITAWKSKKFSLAKGKSSHVEGEDNLALANYSHAEGVGTTASGSGSHAEGASNIASGYESHAEGFYTTASGNYSHAEGAGTTASFDYSHAEGSGTTASGYDSHAEGCRTTALSHDSHAEGYSTNTFSSVVTKANPTNDDIITAWGSKKFSVAKGTSSHVEGQDSLALGEYAHAEGSNTTASGQSSHAEGFFTKASGVYQHAQGKYNIEDSAGTYADIIGNGTSDTARSNAATVDWSGNAWYAGNVYVGSTSGTNKDAGSKKLATEEYASGLGITNATVGQIAKITAVDSNGKPTAWEPVDMASGDTLRLVVDTTTTEDVAQIEFTEDIDGNPLKLKKFIFNLSVPAATGTANATIGANDYRWYGGADTPQYSYYGGKTVKLSTSKTTWWGEICMNIEADGKYAILYKRATNIPYSNDTLNSDGGTYDSLDVRYAPYSSGAGIYYFHETIDRIFYKSGSTTVMIPTGTKIKIWGVDA